MYSVSPSALAVMRAVRVVEGLTWAHRREQAGLVVLTAQEETVEAMCARGRCEVYNMAMARQQVAVCCSE